MGNTAGSIDPSTSRRAEAPTGRAAARVVLAGAAVVLLGGMIGLGGAEFRLPLLISLFGFAALQAVILNKAMNLVVLTALPARPAAVPYGDLAPHWDVAFNLLAGSLLGAYVGATWAPRMATATLYRVLPALLLTIAAALVAGHVGTLETLELTGAPQTDRRHRRRVVHRHSRRCHGRRRWRAAHPHAGPAV